MFLAAQNTKKWFLPVYMHAYIDIEMCSSLSPEEFGRYYSYLVLKSSSIIGQCPVNMEHLSPKIGALHIASKSKMVIFL
jgi:hypothetical protein